MKRFSTLVTREVQIKTTSYTISCPVEYIKFKNMDSSSIGEDVKQLEFMYVGGSVKSHKDF